MANTISPHDKLFKITMPTPEMAKEFLENYLPLEIKQQINLETLKLRKDSFVDEHFKGHFVDLLYSVNFKASNEYIYILFEHLSNPNEMIAFRLSKYVSHIMDNHLRVNKNNKLPIVYPIVIYTGQKHYGQAQSYFDLFAEKKELAKYVCLQQYQLVNFQNITNEEIQSQIRFGL